jgi:hypothetical protein
MWLLLLVACFSGIRSAYELEKTTVLRSPDPVQPGWTGQVRVRLGSAALRRIARRAVAAGLLQWEEQIRFDPPLAPTLTLTPRAHVTQLNVRLDRSCAACLYLDASMDGEAQITAGPLSGGIPFSADVQATVSMQVVPTDTTWQVIGRIESVEDIQVRTFGGIGGSIVGPLRTWVTNAIRRVPPFVLGEVGGAELPVRAARLGTDGRALELSLITAVADAVPIPPADQRVEGDWDVRLHPETLAAILKYGGHMKGAGKHGIIDVPTALRVDGDSFELDIRLWRLVRSGWWRDFKVTGRVEIDGDQLNLIPVESQPTGKSRNAGWVDPIFALAERKTLSGVANGVQRALPATADAHLGGMSLTPRITALWGTSEAIVLQGTID